MLCKSTWSEDALSLHHLHLQDSLASTAPCRSSPSESDQSDRFKFFHETQDPNEFSQRRNEQWCVEFCLWKTAQSKEVATIMAGQTNPSVISNCQEWLKNISNCPGHRSAPTCFTVTCWGGRFARWGFLTVGICFESDFLGAWARVERRRLESQHFPEAGRSSHVSQVNHFFT